MPLPRLKRLFRISLRTTLFGVTVLCILLAWRVPQVERQKSTVKWVEEWYGFVTYDYHWSDDICNYDAEPPRPAWLRELIGVDYFATVVGVEFAPEHGPDDLKPLANLRRLRHLECPFAPVDDLSPLTNLTNLETADLSNTNVADISPLENMDKLQYLYLSETRVTDVTPLAQLKNLRELTLDSTEVSDCSPLFGLTNLEFLDISFTKVSVKGIEDLQKALPRCEIVAMMD